LLFDWIEQRTHHELSAEVKQMFHNISSRKGGLYVLSVHHRMVKKPVISFICAMEQN
jgi:hypothetical protein